MRERKCKGNSLSNGAINDYQPPLERNKFFHLAILLLILSTSQKARNQCLPPKGKPSELRVRGSILQPNSTASLGPPILYQYSRREKKRINT